MISSLRFALRQIVKSPGQALAVILVLALGIGANTAIFSVIYGVMLRPLPYPHPEQLVNVWESKMPQFPTFPLSPPNFLDYAKAQSFEAVAAIRSQGYVLLGRDEPLRIAGAKVTGDYFRVYGTPPLLGRWLLPAEDAIGQDNAVVLAHGIWQRVFGGKPDVVGQTVNLNGRPMTIVGVMPPEWRRESRAEIYTSMAFEKRERESSRGAHYINAVGRLKAGVTVEQATAELKTINANLAQQYPANLKGWDIKLASTFEDIVGNVRQVLGLLLGAVGCVLLIACANIANLRLAQAAGRSREFAVRSAVGADRLRLIRQLLAESLVLSLIGGVLGVLVAQWGLRALLAIAPAALPRVSEIGLDFNVLAFTAAVTAVTGIIFGLFPAWQASRVNLVDALKDGARGTSGGRHRLRHGLVVAEIALCFVLLIGAGLLLRSFGNLRSLDLGFDPRDATVVAVNVAVPKNTDPDQAVINFTDQVSEKFRALLGVTAVGLTHSLPQAGNWSFGFTIQGRPAPADGETPNCSYFSVTPGYFSAMRIRLLRGRLLSDRDTASAPPVCVISESLAKQYFPGEDAIGQRINAGGGDGKFREVVGIVADVRDAGGDQQLFPQLYDSYYQYTYSNVAFIVRTDGPAVAPMLQGLRPAIFSVNKDQPVSSVRALADVVADSISRQRFTATLLTLFATIALLIAAVGIYGVMSYTVSQRTNEMGVRLALGAQPSAVLALVLRQGMGIVGLGLLLGAVAALALGRVVESMLFQTSVREPLVFAGIAAALAFVALLACWLPARRAAKVDPMIALRAE